MQVFEVHQELFGLEAKYYVYKEGGKDLIMTLKGTEAIMRLYDGDEGAPLGSFRMRSILSETKFEVFDGEERIVARFEFPLFEIKKSFRLLIGEERYLGKGGIRGRTFTFLDKDDEVALKIAKQPTFRDRYIVTLSSAIPVSIALLATAVVDQKHFEHRA
jgi:hypothetical protein